MVGEDSRTEPVPSKWPPPADWSPSAEVLELDYVFDALAHPRRRYVCYRLLENPEWSLDTLATLIAAWENELPQEDVTEDLRERVSVALYHNHVPKLADDGIVEFDAESNEITTGENCQLVLAALVGIGAGLQTNNELSQRQDRYD